MYGTRKRREVKSLLRRGCSQASAARLAGVSVATVKRIAREPDDECQLTDKNRARLRRVGRPSMARRFRNIVSRLLDQNPAVKTAVVLRVAKRLGYEGGKSAMYALVAELRADKEPTKPPTPPEQQTRPIAYQTKPKEDGLNPDFS